MTAGRVHRAPPQKKKDGTYSIDNLTAEEERELLEYPQEIRTDGSFGLASPALKEWAGRHDVTLAFPPPRPASKAIFERLHATLGGKPAGDEYPMG
jgi:hypothetical protein